MTEPVSGLVLVDKPSGLTSHDVVARVRRLAGTRKVGHAGTLDPMATGVLVVGINRATRLLGHLMLTEKTYDATIRLGESTVTDDAEGELVAAVEAGELDPATVREALRGFVGEIQQVPTSVSAVKVDGRRAYQRVRAGEDVDLPARTVTIHDLSVHEVRSHDRVTDVAVSLRCSSGTYVRAVARDLGRRLDVGGHLVALRRTAVGGFTASESRTLDQLSDDFEVHPIAEAARRSFPAVDLSSGQADDVRFGRPLAADLGGSDPVAVFAPDGEFLALYAAHAPGQARAVAVFV